MPEADTGPDGASAEADLLLLETAARRAGELALTFFGKNPETWFKGKPGMSPVSEADLAVDKLLAEDLRGARLGYGWLSEETADDRSRLDHTRVFIVDPIDGTRAFLAGGDEWTVSIAVVDSGRPVAGAVYCPVRDEMFLARAGGGAFLNGTRMSVSSRRSVSGATLTGPHSIVANSDVIAAGFVGTDILRSLAYRLVTVAAGRVDIGTARGGPSDWDLAAADLLVQEAGGKLTDVKGRLLTYNRPKTGHPGLIAAPDALIDAARAALRSAIG
ncbi:3'(2'),5'-bisphosphate nucleotidase CysQ [Labrenzia sp. VG12]|uniref:3'(2'),5'-bisphosphate nucleotidase CysQ n=1 Tax=Labrenzia sp. VG12 TaxID=2021862 RepID=UPI000B8C4328|nr:3'(2'),5'-bisphosphate nucleotidase CysQ [Labrenzia sp. VG12]ASP36202.1 3'(2'),5'-bisphosphate nucleotidase CysQ [Labrenzia sp. VG12]